MPDFWRPADVRISEKAMTLHACPRFDKEAESFPLEYNWGRMFDELSSKVRGVFLKTSACANDAGETHIIGVADGRDGSRRYPSPSAGTWKGLALHVLPSPCMCESAQIGFACKPKVCETLSKRFLQDGALSAGSNGRPRRQSALRSLWPTPVGNAPWGAPACNPGGSEYAIHRFYESRWDHDPS
jgi:hypothetical protein